MDVTIELIIILFSFLVAFGILIYNPAKFLGIPSLVIFMGIGLALGNGEGGLPVFDFPEFTSFISSLALNLIIFSGGFQSPMEKIKGAFKEGIVLSTVGVLITAITIGFITHWVTGLPLLISILFGAIASSTDAASVFSIIESKNIKFRHRTDTILEFESATNDPMALILVTVFTLILSSKEGAEVSYFYYVFLFFKQLTLGGLGGWAMATGVGKLLQKITLQERGSVPIFIIAILMITVFGIDLLGGNMLIAAYVFGVVLGNKEFQGRQLSDTFFHSFSWLGQVTMYLFLGLQLAPNKLIDDFWIALLPALLLIVIARPIGVLISYLPFRKVPLGKKLFISLIGLKGATPIVFAFMPILAGIEGAHILFDMVFFVVVFSIFIQGSLLAPLARKFKLIDEED
ncbi:potassium/proton antiporter [Flammeovirgaceae bacterium SG7u.111]|nr:potassium/proton antiporter [Flammeovirgaceae bacterium SG7u.132]WPO38368.1 potassium/proton antiporter [Flammeovirgaceae bacterium SG7u.111]